MAHKNLYIVDNSSEDQSVKKYLTEWCSVSKQMDIATGYLEIGGLLALDTHWQKLDKIRIILGNEVTKRTKDVIDAAVAAILNKLKNSVDHEQEHNEFLIGVPAILDALKSGKIECRVYDRSKFHAKAYITYFRDEYRNSNRGGTYIFPLYIYWGDDRLAKPQYNFNSDIVKRIESGMGLKLSLSPSSDGDFSGIELLQYIYAILYCKSYRKKYNDQLKYDFPSIPYPTNAEQFRALAQVGKKLFDIHLPDLYYRNSKSPVVLSELSTYKFINDTVVLNGSLVIQAFTGVKEKMLGGYAPADKWLKDRKGKAITESDIAIYKRIIQTLAETDTLMEEIESIISFK